MADITAGGPIGVGRGDGMAAGMPAGDPDGGADGIRGGDPVGVLSIRRFGVAPITIRVPLSGVTAVPAGGLLWGIGPEPPGEVPGDLPIREVSVGMKTGPV